MLLIAARHGARNVRIFGSVARAAAGRDSDVDLLVDLEPGRSLFDLAGFWMELQDPQMSYFDFRWRVLFFAACFGRGPGMSGLKSSTSLFNRNT